MEYKVPASAVSYGYFLYVNSYFALPSKSRDLSDGLDSIIEHYSVNRKEIEWVYGNAPKIFKSIRTFPLEEDLLFNSPGSKKLMKRLRSIKIIERVYDLLINLRCINGDLKDYEFKGPCYYRGNLTESVKFEVELTTSLDENVNIVVGVSSELIRDFPEDEEGEE